MSYWFLKKAGIAITIEVDKASEQLVCSGLVGLHLKPTDKIKGVYLSVQQNDDGWHLSDYNEVVDFDIKLPGDLIYYLTDRIVFHIANTTKQAHCLHAGAVASSDKVVLIPASSGSGKSSFTAWLITNGFAYLSDELILLTPEQKVTGLARPIQIKPHGLDAVQPLIKNPQAVNPGDLANSFSIESFDGTFADDKFYDLGLIIFPEYNKDAKFEFKQISIADAGMSLMSNHINARNLDDHGFREIVALIRRVPCYELKYGGFDYLPSDFIQQIETILTA